MDRFSRKYDGTNKTVSHRWKGKERPSHYHGISGLSYAVLISALPKKLR